MKLNELMMVLNENQRVVVVCEDKEGEMVEVAEYNGRDAIDDKYNEQEVHQVSAQGYGFRVVIEKPVVVRECTVHFEVPSWFDLCETRKLRFENDEDDYEIEEYVRDEFEEWLDSLLDDMRSDASCDIEDIDEI